MCFFLFNHWQIFTNCVIFGNFAIVPIYSHLRKNCAPKKIWSRKHFDKYHVWRYGVASLTIFRHIACDVEWVCLKRLWLWTCTLKLVLQINKYFQLTLSAKMSQGLFNGTLVYCVKCFCCCCKLQQVLKLKILEYFCPIYPFSLFHILIWLIKCKIIAALRAICTLTALSCFNLDLISIRDIDVKLLSVSNFLEIFH